MKPLESQRKIFTKLCMYPSEENESRWEKVIRIMLSCTIFAIFVVFFTSSAVYIWESADLEAKLYAIFQIFGGLVVIYPFMVAILLRQKVAAIFKILAECFEQYNDDEGTFHFLVWANNTSEWLWDIYKKYGIFGLQFVIFLHYIASIALSIYFDGALNAEDGFQMYQLIFPWNQQTQIGYIMEMLFSLSMAQCYILVHGTFILFFISLCLYHQAFYEMSRHSARILETSDVGSDHKMNILKLHHLHISNKNFFKQTAKVYIHIIMIELIANMIMSSSTVFQIDLKLGHNDYDISFILLPASAGILSLFVYCYLGKMATDSFLGMSDCLYECNWQELPVDLQKSFVLMIQNTQKSVHYHGFGIVRLNLETFCDFIRAIFKFYMLFKTVTNRN